MRKIRAFARGIGKFAGYFASLRPCQSHDHRIVFGLLSYWNPAIRVIYLLVSSNPGKLSYRNPANRVIYLPVSNKSGCLSSGIIQYLPLPVYAEAQILPESNKTRWPVQGIYFTQSNFLNQTLRKNKI
jgi:hypothetical protein